jgi:hypothetical protein
LLPVRPNKQLSQWLQQVTAFFALGPAQIEGVAALAEDRGTPVACSLDKGTLADERPIPTDAGGIDQPWVQDTQE